MTVAMWVSSLGSWKGNFVLLRMPVFGVYVCRYLGKIALPVLAWLMFKNGRSKNNCLYLS